MDGGAATRSSSVPPPSPRPDITLAQPKKKRPGGSSRPLGAFLSLFRSFPILAPAACRSPAGALPRVGARSAYVHNSGATRITGTLFGHRKARITLGIQESPRSVPVLLLEIAVPTGKFMQEMGTEALRISLECEKEAPGGDQKTSKATRLLEEPLWTAYVNGRKVGYAVRREPTERDLEIMKLLYSVSMGAGVLPDDMSDPVDGEMTYMRAYFDRVVGSKDSETLYMLNPDGNNGPELSIFFVRV